MLTRTRIKFLVAISMTPVLVGIGLAMIYGLSQFMASFQQGADPASIFRGNVLLIPERTQAQWRSTAPPQGIAPSKAQQEELIAAYWEAWQALSRAYQTGLSKDLNTYWALPALERVQAAIDPENTLAHETSRHQLRLLFFSDDRSVAQVQDEFILTQGEIVLAGKANITLTLDNGRWRIRLIEVGYSLLETPQRNLNQEIE